MKKIILLTLIISSLGVNAQSLIPTKFGLKVGLNMANLNITPTDGVTPTENSTQMGIAAGICIHIPLSDKWYINPEVLYSQKGASFNYTFTHDYPDNQRAEYTTTTQLTLSYVELNPTISFKASDKLALNFGPSVSFLISQAESSTKKLTNGIEGTVSNVLLDGFYESNALDVGLNVGLSYFLTENFLVDARVYTGFMEAGTINQPYPENQIIPDAEYSVKNRAIVISFAYLF
jgi:long-subunit fatty acid transport protein